MTDPKLPVKAPVKPPVPALQRVKEAAKMITALVGALLTAGTALIPAGWHGWLGLALAVATAAATYAVPNAQPTK